MPTMTKVLIQLPASLKAKFDALKPEGYTASGFMRALLEQEMNNPEVKKGA